jgi:hypothetical protein
MPASFNLGKGAARESEKLLGQSQRFLIMPQLHLSLLTMLMLLLLLMNMMKLKLRLLQWNKWW